MYRHVKKLEYTLGAVMLSWDVGETIVSILNIQSSKLSARLAMTAYRS